MEKREIRYKGGMDGTILISTIMGGLIDPWEIEKIEMDTYKKIVLMYVEYPKSMGGRCPKCGERTAIHDMREERVWRHLDMCEYRTFIHGRVPRSKCDTHGVLSMNVPWSSEKNHFTKTFEMFAILLLRGVKNRKETASLLRLSWDEIDGIMKRAVQRGMARRKEEGIEYLGVDEKNFHCGQSYVQILTDLHRRRVLEVVERRDEKAVEKAYQCLTAGQKAGVKGISMDFWKAYINGAEKHLPNADIVHDKFHIMAYMNDAVDAVRRSEHKALKKAGEETLTGTKYLWLKNEENMSEKQKTTFKELQGKQLDVNRAWQRKEMLQQFWNCADEESARKYFKSWYFSATHSRLLPVIKVAKMLKRHFDNIITYWKHYITNSFAEGINSVIQYIKSSARGFRNFQNYRNAILFYCGNLSLFP